MTNRNITFFNFGSFLVYPNPAAESLQIAVTGNESFTVMIYDQDRNILKKEEGYDANSSMDVSALKQEIILSKYYKIRKSGINNVYKLPGSRDYQKLVVSKRYGNQVVFSSFRAKRRKNHLSRTRFQA